MREASKESAIGWTVMVGVAAAGAALLTGSVAGIDAFEANNAVIKAEAVTTTLQADGKGNTPLAAAWAKYAASEKHVRETHLTGLYINAGIMAAGGLFVALGSRRKKMVLRSTPNYRAAS